MAQNNVIKEIFIKKGNVNLLDKQLGAEAQNIDVSYDANGNIIEDITEPGVVINETKSLTSALLDMQDNISDKTVTWEEMDLLGSKNFLITAPDNITDNGITFIVDSNGIITMNGRASEEAIYEITLPQPINYGCKFTISCPNLAQGVSVFVLNNNDTVIGDGYFGENGKTGDDEILINNNQNIFKIRIKVRANILVSNLILKPMLRLSCIKDKNFASYAMTNKELTNEVIENKVLLKDTVGWTRKNLLVYPYVQTSKTESGITFTDNGDGSVTLNGTSTGAVFFVFNDRRKIIDNGNYVFSKEPSNNSVMIGVDRVKISDNSYVNRYGDNASDLSVAQVPIVVDDADVNYARFWVAVRSGVTVNNVTIYPMLRKTEIADDTYEPYHVPVTDYAHEAVADGVGWGNKNLLSYPYVDSVKTTNGITFTANADGTVTANGTANGGNAVFLFKNDGFDAAWTNELVGKKVTLTGGVSENVHVQLWRNTGSPSSFRDDGGGATFEFPDLSSTNWNVALVVMSGTTVSNAIIKPMLRRADIVDAIYEPYHPTVKQTLRDAEVIEGKNLIPFPYNGANYSVTVSTFTVNQDGTIFINGTQGASEGSYFLTSRQTYDLTLDAGTYRFSGAIANTSVEINRNTVTGDASQGYTNIGYDNGNGLTFTLTARSDIQLKLTIGANKSFNSVTIYPLLCYATEDGTFEPYYIPLKDSKFDRVEQGVLGAKNWFTTSTIYAGENNCTISENGKVIRINNATAGTFIMTEFLVPVTPNTDYIITADAIYTSGNGNLVVTSHPGNVTIKSTGYFTSNTKIILEFNSGNNEIVRVKLMCTNGASAIGDVTYNNTMLRLASDPDGTYAPYAMTNKQLTESKDSWTGTATVNSSNQVTFTGLNDNYGYSNPCFENKLVNVTTMTKSGSGSNVTLVFTLSGASQGDVCKLRIFK